MPVPRKKDEETPLQVLTTGIVVPKLEIKTISLTVVGISPLICHKFGTKARKQMVDKQTGKASSGRAPKDPQQDYESSLYLLDGEPAFPANAFKQAAVTACSSLKGSITKTLARQAFFVMEEKDGLVKIRGKPRIREDVVRLSGRQRVADIRYRAEFPEWSCDLLVRYNQLVLTDEQIANLFRIAGFAVGVGEWRPEKGGVYGQFDL